MAREIGEAFERFLGASYGSPHGLSFEQMTALKDAFYGGAITALTARQNPSGEVGAYLNELCSRVAGKQVH